MGCGAPVGACIGVPSSSSCFADLLGYQLQLLLL